MANAGGTCKAASIRCSLSRASAVNLSASESCAISWPSTPLALCPAAPIFLMAAATWNTSAAHFHAVALERGLLQRVAGPNATCSRPSLPPSDLFATGRGDGLPLPLPSSLGPKPHGGITPSLSSPSLLSSTLQQPANPKYRLRSPRRHGLPPLDSCQSPG